ncbi:6687_t:CDS:1 [Dentiscutata erythropus]|uniref:6687_t:CDS:1 n=1 Tax=Dentiscutata erythropus TaxID=1348616 RepID=A0A9N9P9M2_9GLOM|nr:6687_t:CDS:1 [Dentiscutata erythropus]
MSRQSKISRSSGSNSFNNPSAPGIHNFRIGLSESTERQHNPLRIPFLEYRIADLTLQLSSAIQENNNLRSQVAALQDQLVAVVSILNNIEEFSNNDQPSVNEQSS